MTQKEFKNRYQYNPETDRLGESGSGSVFKACDTHRDRWVALKISKVNPDKENTRLKKEIETAAQLPSHPNIAGYDACYTFASFDGEYDFGIQQYYEQGNLLHLLKQGGLSSAQKQNILEQILSGIEFLHAQGIVHCKLKSQNILIVKRGEEYVPKIRGFGGSVTESENPEYASPEQLGERTVDKNSDLWSFGIIAYQTLTGTLPFTAGEHAETDKAGRLKLFRQISSGQLPAAINSIAEPWQRLIRACLVPEPEKRVKNCNECIALLKGEAQREVKQEDANPEIHYEDMTLEAPNPEPKSASKSKSVKRILLGIAGGIAALLLILFTVRKLTTDNKELAVVKLNGKYGFIDKTGKEIIPFKYDQALSFSEGLAPVALNTNRKWGFIDKTGKEIISGKYDNAGIFSEGLARVEWNGKYGFIDKTGKEIIPRKYDFAWDFSEGLAEVQLNGELGFIDKTGKEIIPFKYDYAGNFSEGLASVRMGTWENGKYGYVDKTGNKIISLKYDKAGDFSEGLAPVELLNGKSGFINKTDKEIIPFKYDNARGFSEGLAAVCISVYDDDGKWGFIDKVGKEIIPCKYDFTEDFSEGLASVTLNGKFGFINTTGSEVIPIKYDYAESFSEGLAAIKLDGKWGFIDKTGKEIIPCKYGEASSFSQVTKKQ